MVLSSKQITLDSFGKEDSQPHERKELLMKKDGEGRAQKGQNLETKQPG